MSELASHLCSGICHQLPERTLHLGEVALPACARCTGVHLGALAMLLAVWLRGRIRSSVIWPTWVMGLFLVIWGLMGLDVVSAGLWPDLPWTNARRLVTGLLTGLTLPALLVPVMNLVSPSSTEEGLSPLQTPRDLAAPVGLALLLVAPLALPIPLIWIAVGWAAVTGLAGLMTLINLTLIRALSAPRLLSRRREWPHWLLAAGLAVVELEIASWLRVMMGPRVPGL
ncbi:DUF2085 domain-containing protein [Candidatus Sumerlaeota bacterium]|nr:DUF2085 domain-containing protein [Candidatus Sumerlaeota bacterium]